jgi:hypothetical protein
MERGPAERRRVRERRRPDRRPRTFEGGTFVSIVRVGLAETKHFAEGYDAIFGKKTVAKEKKEQTTAQGRKGKKKSAKKK